MRLLRQSLALFLAVSCGALCNCAHADWISTLNSVAGADGISYWNLQESTGTTAGDSWTIGFDGTNNGTFSGDGTGLTLGVAGPRPSDSFKGMSPSNNAVRFNGSASQLLQMANSSHFAGKQSLTMTMFYQIPDGTAGNDRFLGGLADNTLGGSGRYGFVLHNYDDPRMRAYWRVHTPPAGAESSLSATSPTLGAGGTDSHDGTWHLAALTMNDEGADKRFNLYIDGELEVSALLAGGAGKGLVPRHTSGATGVLNFGRDLGDSTRAFIGNVDEITFIDRALTLGEVGQLWQAALVPEPTSSVLVISACGVICGLRRRGAKRA